MDGPGGSLPVLPAHVDAVRRFNRFHTQLAGALGERLLASRHTLPQVRVLYEVAHAPAAQPATAAQLAQQLALDPGYVCRLVGGLQTQGLITRTPVAGQARCLVLKLTAAGRREVRALEAASRRQVHALLAGLAPSEREDMVLAMARIQSRLGRDADGAPITLREPVAGDLGWVVHRQAVLYAREYGWDASFETLLAQIVGRFGREYIPGRERCWVADRAGEVVGSVFVVQEDDSTAKLRMLYVEPSARGQGLARRLVNECLGFARQAGYTRMVLWTNDVLVAARHLYQKAGFTLLEQAPHRSFGHDLVGQVWTRAL